MLSRKEIDKKITEYLIQKELQLARFLFSFKTFPVSKNDSGITSITAFARFYLKPVVQTIGHILVDTTDFLGKLKYLPEIQKSAVLVMFVIGQ